MGQGLPGKHTVIRYVGDLQNFFGSSDNIGFQHRHFWLAVPKRCYWNWCCDKSCEPTAEASWESKAHLVTSQRQRKSSEKLMSHILFFSPTFSICYNTKRTFCLSFDKLRVDHHEYSKSIWKSNNGQKLGNRSAGKRGTVSNSKV